MSEATTPAGASPDTRALRAALGTFATGVTIVTCRGADGAAVGLTVNSFAALSLEPALVLWSLRLASPSLAPFDQARHFAINVLGQGQVDISRRFASPVEHKFDAQWWQDGQDGVPLLVGSAAVFECERHQEHTTGDHRLYIGKVLRFESRPLPPLVYQGGHYHQMGELL